MTKVFKSEEWLSWEVNISGSKNASLPIIAASLLLRWKIKLTNVPHIWDVVTFLDILASIWAKYVFSENTLLLDTTNLDLKNIDEDRLKKIRVSILLLAPILHHFWELNIPYPGGCSIWKRPVDSHLTTLEKIWYSCIASWENIHLKWELITWEIELNAWFSVTATENIIVANVLRNWITKIRLSAIEPHVVNLIDFLKKAWANITMEFDHTIVISWVEKLKNEIEFEIAHDYIESGTFMIIWALASKEYLDINNARIWDLYSFIDKLNSAWVRTEKIWEDKLRVYRCKNIKPVNFQTNIFPGFPTDLQSPFCVLLTQADWVSKINEILFEGRLNFMVELEKMRAHPALLNPHEALLFWPTKLRGSSVTSWDLRAWAAMVIAWLIAEWHTEIHNVDYIRRWYENFFEKLTKLWAIIK